MKEILELIEGYGLPLVLLIGAVYTIYRFMVFSLYEVKNTFTKRHEDNAESMAQVKESLAEIKSDIKLLVEFISKK